MVHTSIDKAVNWHWSASLTASSTGATLTEKCVSRQTSATCQEVRGRISAYLDGDLRAPACHEIDQHYRNSAECAALSCAFHPSR
jgi:hypothetical protein